VDIQRVVAIPIVQWTGVSGFQRCELIQARRGRWTKEINKVDIVLQARRFYIRSKYP
jgi:hypothetical protein